MTRGTKAAVVAACALALVVPSVLLFGPRIATSVTELRAARIAEHALMDDLRYERGVISKTRNYSKGLDALVKCADGYDKIATTSLRMRGLLSGVRDSIASVVVSWGSFELWHGGTDMPSRWKGDTTTEEGRLAYMATRELAKISTDSVSRRPGDDSVKLKRLFYSAMDQGLSIIGANLTLLNLQAAYYGYPSEQSELLKYGNEIQMAKFRTLLVIYRRLYGRAELEYFLVEHKLPKDLAVPGIE